jgi:N-acetylglucosamine repressor
MRPVDLREFRLATRSTTREINRQIALNLIRTHQPISRAGLARVMGTRRSVVTLLVNELIDEGLVFEGATGEAKRGRKPKSLYIDSRGRCVVAVDIRPTGTSLLITDLVGRELVGVTSFATERDPRRFATELARRIRALLSANADAGRCVGVGVVVPGMVEQGSERVLLAPHLGWKDVRLKEALSGALSLPVHLENSGRACALAQVWAARGEARAPGNLVFVTVSDGLGVGVVIGGELLRGQHNIAGEFGHMPLSMDGPRCACGATGCWEAHVSNLATLSRYLGRDLQGARPLPAGAVRITVDDLIARARSGDGKAMAAIKSTARYLGVGLGGLINAVDPSRIYIAGEILGAWDLIEATVRAGLAERTLTKAAATTEIVCVPAEQHPRLQGAAALVAAPAFARPAVA